MLSEKLTNLAVILARDDHFSVNINKTLSHSNNVVRRFFCSIEHDKHLQAVTRYKVNETNVNESK